MNGFLIFIAIVFLVMLAWWSYENSTYTTVEALKDQVRQNVDVNLDATLVVQPCQVLWNTHHRLMSELALACAARNHQRVRELRRQLRENAESLCREYAKCEKECERKFKKYLDSYIDHAEKYYKSKDCNDKYFRRSFHDLCRNTCALHPGRVYDDEYRRSVDQYLDNETRYQNAVVAKQDTTPFVGQAQNLWNTVANRFVPPV